MKKFYFILAIISILFLGGCGLNDAKYITLTDKPSADYYTKEIHSKILSGDEYSITVFDTNLYKDIKVDSSEKYVIEEFLNSLSTQNFTEVSEPQNEKEPYRIILNFSGTKYQLKVFNANSTTISPWDGKYKADSINFKDIPQRYNLFDFCEYIKKNH
ncbi:MAG: DUF4883 family protein [Clostridium sp.]